jgi:hypothetical protein
LSVNAETLQTKQRFSISTNKANEMVFMIFFRLLFQQAGEHEKYFFASKSTNFVSQEIFTGARREMKIIGEN